MEEHLNFPEYDIRKRIIESRSEVFDNVRNVWILLTPEEWVRQNIIHYLINENKIPKSLIAVEMPIKMNSMQRRCDIVVYTKSGKPKMIVECKAPSVKINQQTVDQASRYNLTLKVPFLLVTNGLQHYSFFIDFENKTTEVLKTIPDYPYLLKH